MVVHEEKHPTELSHVKLMGAALQTDERAMVGALEQGRHKREIQSSGGML